MKSPAIFGRIGNAFCRFWKNITFVTLRELHAFRDSQLLSRPMSSDVPGSLTASKAEDVLIKMKPGEMHYLAKNEHLVLSTSMSTPFDCINKLQPNEPYFVLRGQDATASGVVRQWAQIAQRNRCNPDKVANALKIAEAMDAYPHSRKPD